MKLLIFRNFVLLVSLCVLVSARSYCQQSSANNINVLTPDEKKAGWVLLFDGKTNAGWRGANKETFPEKGWEIKDGILSVLGQKGGDIITKKKYGDFDLKIEFRVKEQKANSGIKYYVLENEYEKGKTLGLEFQTANSHPGTHLISTIGSLYEILAPDDKLLHPAPAGEWNQVRIVSKNNEVQHWLNGYKILQYKRGGKEFREGVLNSKFKEIKNFGEVAEGYILLQDHNDETSFINIKILEL